MNSSSSIFALGLVVSANGAGVARRSTGYAVLSRAGNGKATGLRWLTSAPNSSNGLDLNAPRKPSEIYEKLVEAGEVRADEAQRQTLVHLDQLFETVIAHRPVAEAWTGMPEHRTSSADFSTPQQEARIARNNAKKQAASGAAGGGGGGGGGWFSNLASSTTSSLSRMFQASPAKPAAPATPAPALLVPPPRGLYIHGGPGSGKTFLMDLFYNALPFKNGKRRVHFHEFMLEVHRHLHDLQRRGVKGSDMMDACVETLRKKSWIICFDEFQVTDVADAMVMRRLFGSLFTDAGLILVATSNRGPDELYKRGMQREFFVPFIEDLKVRCRVVGMQSQTDYRLVASESMEADAGQANSSVYFVSDPKSVKPAAQFERIWENMSKGDVTTDLAIRVQGRSLEVPQCGRHTDVARFGFTDLCGKPVGAVDYYAIASTFHTIFLENIPRMTLKDINQLRRFITLVDTFYDQGVVLVVKADAPIKELFTFDGTIPAALTETDVIGTSNYTLHKIIKSESGAQESNIDEVFAFSRTVSRLQEMQTPQYLEKVAKSKRAAQMSAVRFFSQFEMERAKPLVSEGDARQVFDRYDENHDGVLDVTLELPKMLEEMTLFQSGHRHVSEESLEATKKFLDPQSTGKIDWETFKIYLTETNGVGLLREGDVDAD